MVDFCDTPFLKIKMQKEVNTTDSGCENQIR